MTQDTSLGGGRRGFPETTWGMISRLRDPGVARYREGLEDLAARYWKPVYRYIRIGRTKSNEEAKDLTQAFFLWLLDGDALRRYVPEKGAFRAYLKIILSRFVRDQDRVAESLKRGGAARRIPLDEEFLSAEVVADPKAADPEKEFDRAWAREVSERAIERVRARFAAEGREAAFRAFEEYALRGERRTYADVAASLGLSESDVRNHLHAAREAVRREIREQISETVSGPGEIEEEWNALFGA